MSESGNGFDYQKMKEQIASDSTLSEKQKEVLLADLDKKFKVERKILDIKVSNEIPQKTQDDIALAERTREMLRLKFTEYGLDCPKLENLEDMDKASAILKKLKEKEDTREAPSGSAPLNDAQLGKGRNEDGFETYSEMVDALRIQEKFGSDEEKAHAKTILNQLFQKWVQAKKNDPSLADKIEQQETPKEYLDKRRKRRGARNE